MDNNLYLNPNRRHDFVLFFDVTDGNPNGDPDAGNLPRFDPETNYGFVTDVSLKRKIRDYVAMFYNKEIYIQSKEALNTLYNKAAIDLKYELPAVEIIDDGLWKWVCDEAGAIFDTSIVDGNRIVEYKHRFEEKTKNKQKSEIINRIKGEEIELPKEIEDNFKKLIEKIVDKNSEIAELTKKDREVISNYMVRKYYDIRMFGAVLTAGTNAGQIRGPLQLTFARTLSPIFPRDITITRIAVTKESDKRKKDTEMGRKHFIHYGLYRAHGFYNPKLAERLINGEDGFKNPVKDEDLKILWDALQNMFEVHHTSSSGEVRFRGLYIFSHDDETGKGKAHAHKLFDLVSTGLKNQSNPPRSFDDYYPLPEQKSIVLPEGIQLKTFGV
ncbi:MAG: CRISPR-associated protein [Lutisporaceae bacterium]|jgi:CRISPR-associated protein Csd2